MLSGSVKKVSAPRIIQDPTVSPGWTRAVNTTPFLYLKFSKLSAEVIVRTSQGSPERVLQRTAVRTSFLLSGSDMIALISLRKSLYV